MANDAALAERRVAALERLKRDIPYYSGDAPKAQHYQWLHDALDAAVAALTPATDNAEQPEGVERDICPICDGSGEGVADQVCARCGGSGRVSALASQPKETVELRNRLRDAFETLTRIAQASDCEVSRAAAKNAAARIDAALTNGGEL